MGRINCTSERLGMTNKAVVLLKKDKTGAVNKTKTELVPK